MLRIKKLAHNLFFKFFIGLLVLSFTFFGVSNFVLNSADSWVAKVGGKSISYGRLTKAMQVDREAILRANPQNPQAMQYLESEKFKSDVLGRLVNQVITEKLRDDFGIEASRKIILEGIATDPQFMHDGKFDRLAFKSFLAQNGFDEEKYVKAVQDEIVGAMIVNSISLASPIDEKLVKKVVSLKEEKRAADVIIISDKDVGNITAPSTAELEAFFTKNKQKFVTPEMRKISYVTIGQQDLARSLAITEQEIAAEYEKNKANYQQAEKRNFYHVVFTDEDKAALFLAALEKSSDKDKAKSFAEMAKKLAHKNQKEITLQNISEKDLFPEIAVGAFKLNKHEVSAALKSPLGFHIFFVNDIKAGGITPLAEVKNAIKQNLLRTKNEEFVQKKISEIEDSLLASNSLSETAKKFNLKTHDVVTIDQNGHDTKGAAVPSIKELGDFSKNAYSLQEKQVSKLYYAELTGVFYALKIDEIEKAREKKLDEVKSEITSAYVKEKKLEKLRELATKFSTEIAQKPSIALQIAAQYHLKVEKNKIFPRFFYLEFQGKKIPYSSAFLEGLFSAKVGQIIPASAVSAQEFNIGILREIKKSPITESQLALGKSELEKNHRAEFMQEFNKFLQKKYPIKVNEKFLGATEKQEQK